jgi:transposase InsO family protein
MPFAERHHLHPSQGRLALTWLRFWTRTRGLWWQGDEPNLDTKLAMDAFEHGDRFRGPPITLHSDQGSNVRHRKYREILNLMVSAEQSERVIVGTMRRWRASTIRSRPNGDD